MPGMDGFQAVQSIKNNPRTAAIPILMYTSQEGDLYLGQARALGAEGVLPKQIKQADVTQDALSAAAGHDRRGERPNYLHAHDAGAGPHAGQRIGHRRRSAATGCGASAAPKQSPAAAVARQFARCCRRCRSRSARRSTIRCRRKSPRCAATSAPRSTSHAERLQGDLAALLPAPRAPELDMPTIVPERRPWGAISGWSLALIATAAAAFMSLVVVEPGRRDRRVAHRPRRGVCRARDAARAARGS